MLWDQDLYEALTAISKIRPGSRRKPNDCKTSNKSDRLDEEKSEEVKGIKEVKGDNKGE